MNTSASQAKNGCGREAGHVLATQLYDGTIMEIHLGANIALNSFFINSNIANIVTMPPHDNDNNSAEVNISRIPTKLAG